MSWGTIAVLLALWLVVDIFVAIVVGRFIRFGSCADHARSVEPEEERDHGR